MEVSLLVLVSNLPLFWPSLILFPFWCQHWSHVTHLHRYCPPRPSLHPLGNSNSRRSVDGMSFTWRPRSFLRPGCLRTRHPPFRRVRLPPTSFRFSSDPFTEGVLVVKLFLYNQPKLKSRYAVEVGGLSLGSQCRVCGEASSVSYFCSTQLTVNQWECHEDRSGHPLLTLDCKDGLFRSRDWDVHTISRVKFTERGSLCFVLVFPS